MRPPRATSRERCGVLSGSAFLSSSLRLFMYAATFRGLVLFASFAFSANRSVCAFLTYLESSLGVGKGDEM